MFMMNDLFYPHAILRWETGVDRLDPNTQQRLGSTTVAVVFDSWDPVAVQFMIPEPGGIAEWHFARDLLDPRNSEQAELLPSERLGISVAYSPTEGHATLAFRSPGYDGRPSTNLRFEDGLGLLHYYRRTCSLVPKQRELAMARQDLSSFLAWVLDDFDD